MSTADYVSGRGRIFLDDKVKEFLDTHGCEFCSGAVNVQGVTWPFDAEWMSEQLEFSLYAVVEALKRLAKDPTNHIVLCWKTAENPDIIHIDTHVMEFIEKHTDALLLGRAMENGCEYAFDTAFIARWLGLSENSVACALKRLASDSGHFLALLRQNTTNPMPIREYGMTDDPKFANDGG